MYYLLENTVSNVGLGKKGIISILYYAYWIYAAKNIYIRDQLLEI